MTVNKKKSLVTQKPGINQGRKFLKCATSSCDYFEWEDSIGKNFVKENF